jgi:predicted metal-dependent phosphotriesterase family hydrolase
MPTVNTVLGPVETADLGFTLSHEHVGTNAAGRTPMAIRSS